MTYVELLDAETLGLLVAIFEAGGAAEIAVIDQTAWEHVVLEYGYDADDAGERQRVVRLVGGMVAQLADIGIASADGTAVTLTGLGRLFAGAAAMTRAD